MWKLLMSQLIQALTRHCTKLSLTVKAVNVPNTPGNGVYQRMMKAMGVLLVTHIIRAWVRGASLTRQIDKASTELCNEGNQWKEKPDKFGWYRPTEEYFQYLVKKIRTEGLLCTVEVVYDEGKDFVSIEFTPLPGWVHLCSNPDLATCAYHISCGKGSTMNEQDREHFAAACKRWNGVLHRLRIKWVNPRSYVMRVCETDDLFNCPHVQHLRYHDHLHRKMKGLTISA